MKTHKNGAHVTFETDASIDELNHALRRATGIQATFRFKTESGEERFVRPVQWNVDNLSPRGSEKEKPPPKGDAKSDPAGEAKGDEKPKSSDAHGRSGKA